MKVFHALSAVALVLLWSGSALAQDAAKVDPAHYKPVFENASVRVLRISYPPGAKSVMHQHPDAIVIPLSASSVVFTMPDGKTEKNTLANEMALYTPATTHNVANVGTGAVDALLVEFKAATPGKAVIPTSRADMAIKVLAEGPRAVAYRATAAGTFVEPAGSKHEFDQVVIALGPAQIALSIDGKPAKTTWARGDVQFIGRGTAHESKNTGGKPVDMVIVGIK